MINTAEYDGYVPGEAGAQQRDKYPYVGPNYEKFGEQAGWVYDPGSDGYYRDPKATQDYREQTGLVKPPAEEPGLWDSVKAPVTTGAALTAGYDLTKPDGFIRSGIKDALPGSTPPATPGVTPPTTPPAPTPTPSLPAPSALPGTVPPGAPPSGTLGIAPPVDAPLPPAAGHELAPGNTPTFGPGNTPVSGPPVAPPTTPPAGLFGIEPATIAANMEGVPAAVPAAIIASTYLGGKAGLDLLKGKDTEGPAGWYGRGTLGIATGGLSEVARHTPLNGILSDGDKWKTEGNRLGDLQEDGVYLPENLLNERPTGPRSREELFNKAHAADFIGRDAQGNWVNNKFSQSRDVADLRGEDIVNYAVFAERDPMWFKRSLDERLGIADKALADGAVREHHGTIDLTDKFDIKRGAPRPTVGAPVTAAPSTGRQSPGVYKDSKGKVYYSKNGKK